MKTLASTIGASGAYSAPALVSDCQYGVATSGKILSKRYVPVKPVTASTQNELEVPEHVQKWIIDLEILSNSDLIDDGIDLVIDWFENLYSAGSTVACEKTLLALDPTNLHAAISLAVLSMTLSQKRKFSFERTIFLRRVTSHLSNTRPPSEASKMLAGLA